ncbi:hypothetical protein [Pedobacter frigiditerrae]|uniref:hypothetical protein n=1 Tax=Pedobacter frigiditerrae TaxID=2530452 RepID=UPI00292DD96B|nr:hypothetical protein [Pedobacter frigiditerrae]
MEELNISKKNDLIKIKLPFPKHAPRLSREPGKIPLEFPYSDIEGVPMQYRLGVYRFVAIYERVVWTTRTLIAEVKWKSTQKEEYSKGSQELKLETFRLQFEGKDWRLNFDSILGSEALISEIIYEPVRGLAFNRAKLLGTFIPKQNIEDLLNQLNKNLINSDIGLVKFDEFDDF